MGTSSSLCRLRPPGVGLGAALGLLVACAGAGTPDPGAAAPRAPESAAPTQTPPDAGTGSAPTRSHAAPLPPALAGFDARFAPLWQGSAGEPRRAAVCARVEELTAAAGEVAIGEVPVSGREQEIAWQRDAELLAAAVEELAAACDRGVGFESALGRVYDRYLSLAERLTPGRPPPPGS